MKANEAPEKIYLFENPISETPDYRWLSKKSCDEDIEYTRTDAFIEKDSEWLEEHLLDYWQQSVTDSTNFINDFHKAMEDEQ